MRFFVPVFQHAAVVTDVFVGADDSWVPRITPVDEVHEVVIAVGSDQVGGTAELPVTADGRAEARVLRIIDDLAIERTALQRDAHPNNLRAHRPVSRP